MKFIMAIGLLLVTVTSKAQLFLIGQPKQEIKNWIDTTRNFKVVRENVLTQDKTLPVFIELRNTVKTDEFVRIYFDVNDTCRVYRIMADAKYSVEYIEQLNKIYQKVDDNKWINKSFIFQVFTYVLDGFFIMDYSKI